MINKKMGKKGILWIKLGLLLLGAILLALFVAAVILARAEKFPSIIEQLKNLFRG